MQAWSAGACRVAEYRNDSSSWQWFTPPEIRAAAQVNTGERSRLRAAIHRSLTSSKPLKIVISGGSITAGAGVVDDGGKFYSRWFVEAMQEHLGPIIQMERAAIPGVNTVRPCSPEGAPGGGRLSRPNFAAHDAWSVF